MTLEGVMHELESLGNERTKKIYIGNGAREPLFGVTTGAMKPLFKKIKLNQQLAEQLYATGNYDAMYFAGMIAEPNIMTEADFNRWIELAYFPMLSDFVVATTLAESDCAQSVANRFIDSDKELTMSAGWACYEWLLGWRPDSYFDSENIQSLMDKVVTTVNNQSNLVKNRMNSFIVAVGVSYMPLHEEAIKAAEAISGVEMTPIRGICSTPPAIETIQKQKEKGRLGFKRKAVRC